MTHDSCLGTMIQNKNLIVLCPALQQYTPVVIRLIKWKTQKIPNGTVSKFSRCIIAVLTADRLDVNNFEKTFHGAFWQTLQYNVVCNDTYAIKWVIKNTILSEQFQNRILKP